MKNTNASKKTYVSSNRQNHETDLLEKACASLDEGDKCSKLLDVYVCRAYLKPLFFFCSCMARLLRSAVESSFFKNEFITQQALGFKFISKFQISKLGIKM